MKDNEFMVKAFEESQFVTIPFSKAINVRHKSDILTFWYGECLHFANKESWVTFKFTDHYGFFLNPIIEHTDIVCGAYLWISCNYHENKARCVYPDRKIAVCTYFAFPYRYVARCDAYSIALVRNCDSTIDEYKMTAHGLKRFQSISLNPICDTSRITDIKYFQNLRSFFATCSIPRNNIKEARLYMLDEKEGAVEIDLPARDKATLVPPFIIALDKYTSTVHYTTDPCNRWHSFHLRRMYAIFQREPVDVVDYEALIQNDCAFLLIDAIAGKHRDKHIVFIVRLNETCEVIDAFFCESMILKPLDVSFINNHIILTARDRSLQSLTTGSVINEGDSVIYDAFGKEVGVRPKATMGDILDSVRANYHVNDRESTANVGEDESRKRIRCHRDFIDLDIIQDKTIAPADIMNIHDAVSSDDSTFLVLARWMDDRNDKMGWIVDRMGKLSGLKLTGSENVLMSSRISCDNRGRLWGLTIPHGALFVLDLARMRARLWGLDAKYKEDFIVVDSNRIILERYPSNFVEFKYDDRLSLQKLREFSFLENFVAKRSPHLDGWLLCSWRGFFLSPG